MGIIYKLTSPSGKIYIGQTTRSFQQRLKEHITQSGCVILSFALKKYGFENFEKEILITCDDDLLNIKEIEYMPVPIDLPLNLSSKGSRSLKSVTTTF